MNNDIQVSKEHYDFFKYVNMNRWCSYYTQIEEIIKNAKKRIMIIGIGDGITIDMTKRINEKLELIKVDFDKELNPDICADVRELSKYIDNNNLPDTIVCCQVLEHIPYSYFDETLKEIKKCLAYDGKVILSLPDSGKMRRVHIDIPKIHVNYYAKKCISKEDFSFNGEHYWEVNSAKKYSAKNIRSVINSNFEIIREWNVRYNDYHRFYLLRNRMEKGISEERTSVCSTHQL